jgi:hypothetical protein
MSAALRAVQEPLRGVEESGASDGPQLAQVGDKRAEGGSLAAPQDQRAARGRRLISGVPLHIFFTSERKEVALRLN